MKHVVSISLGSSTRDKRVETKFFGEAFVIERRGTNGDAAASGGSTRSWTARWTPLVLAAMTWA